MIFDLSKETDQLTAIQKTTLGSDMLAGFVKKGGCDLHIHTQASDGADSPARVVQKVIENKLLCFSITDHDSIEGVQDVLRILYKLKSIGMQCPKFVPGIELSVQEEREIHMLGYFPLGGYEKMESFLTVQRDRRMARNEEMCELLTANGMPVSIEELKAEGGAVVGRLHAANIMVRKGFSGNVKEAFNRWLGYGKPCYAKRIKPTAREAIRCILDAGGIPVVAHPYLYDWTSGTGEVSELLLKKLFILKSYGLSGVEAFHGEATHLQRLEIQGAAATAELFCTAGSDYHGDNKRGLLMYQGSTKFFHDNDAVIFAAIIESEDKICVVKQNTGFQAGKWMLPGVARQPGKDAKQQVVETLKKKWGLDVQMKDHYLTVVQESESRRVTLAAFRCTQNGKDGVGLFKQTEEIGFFTPGSLSEMDVMPADAAILDHLRQLSLFSLPVIT